MTRVLRASRRVLNHVYARLSMGSLLIASAIFEIFDTSIERYLGVDIRAYHGMLLLGVFTAAKALHDITEGLLLFRIEEDQQERRPDQVERSELKPTE